MGRQKRIWHPPKFYHIVCRGNRRDPLFRDRYDFIEILHMLAKIYEKIPFQLVSYCFMTNHFHLQMRSQEQPISKVMSLLNKRYANYYNTKYRLTGHVFEKRFFSEMISDTNGMLEVSRYKTSVPVTTRNMSKGSVERNLYRAFLFMLEKLVPGT
ncbi:transposase [Anaerobacillus isosaccharinicus]|uniref:Transposase n=2 Tax=Anaerobacillus isosaccharinicus TaxID=1532552 RepID=A0A1S2LWP4_9BACI|nr:transposase [Anaerobacillus isosaccharinicus]